MLQKHQTLISKMPKSHIDVQTHGQTIIEKNFLSITIKKRKKWWQIIYHNSKIRIVLMETSLLVSTGLNASSVPCSKRMRLNWEFSCLIQQAGGTLRTYLPRSPRDAIGLAIIHNKFQIKQVKFLVLIMYLQGGAYMHTSTVLQSCFWRKLRSGRV